MAAQGVCIVEDFFDPTDSSSFSASCAPELFQCDKEQAQYILRKKTKKAHVFNNVQRMSKSSAYKTTVHKEYRPPNGSNGARITLLECEANTAPMAKYTYQMDVLLHSLFQRKDAQKRDPKNWLKKMTNLAGGSEYQHAHSDQGRPSQFKDEKTFPFVATHGFGTYPFQLWLLPNAATDIKYGFPHTFKPSNLLLMRGDFVHAGGILKDPRCHMEFYPLPEAGLVHGHTHHYWLQDLRARQPARKWSTSFLWQGPHFPFAYPFASYTKNSKQQMRTLISYPPEVTQHILQVSRSDAGDETWKQIATQRF